MITPVNRAVRSSSSSFRAWAAVGAALAFALIPVATPASQDSSTWGQILLGGENCDNSDLPARAALYDPASNHVANTTMKSPRDSATATLIAGGSDAGKVLISGGYDKDSCALASTELYDPATNSFGRGPSMHGVRVWHTATPLTAGPHAGEVLIVGGWGGPIATILSRSFRPSCTTPQPAVSRPAPACMRAGKNTLQR